MNKDLGHNNGYNIQNHGFRPWLLISSTIGVALFLQEVLFIFFISGHVQYKHKAQISQFLSKLEQN